MTKEEMINFGEMFLEVNKDSKNSNIYEFIEKALGLLKQEPCEDCVSRQAVIEQARDYGSKTFLIPINSVKVLPPVTPIRKKGKWENGNPICPCCGEDKFKDLEADIWADWQPKYCPNCGSRMESEQK